MQWQSYKTQNNKNTKICKKENTNITKKVSNNTDDDGQANG